MRNERRRKLQTVSVDHYDGQAIYSGNELIYELGGYLGGGAAGVVYEALSTRTKQHVAIKILNPVGYKLFPSSLLARCIVAIKGRPLLPLAGELKPGDDRKFPSNHGADARSEYRVQSAFGSPHMAAEKICAENVWWLIHPTSKQAIAALEDPSTGHVRELTLPQCIQVWGEQLSQIESKGGQQESDNAELYQEVQVKNQVIKVPRMSKKFIKFATTRRLLHREILNMSGLEHHQNVLRLDEALELVQESKCTTFLVLELAGGGELFDRIKLDCGTTEDTARVYFDQLISGVAFCHNSGVCHRDLKPENLLLADTEEHSTLKIADFGLSAIFALSENELSSVTHEHGADQPAIRRLRSVVGSPHYVAPEVLRDAGHGYDGAKADAWSIGIILYAMIAGNLPFGKDLLKCVRYDRFRKWSYDTKYSDDDPTNEVEFPTWFFPAHFSMALKSLVAQLLYPDACRRLSVTKAQDHVWVRRGQGLLRLEDPDEPMHGSARSPAPGSYLPHPNRATASMATLQDVGPHSHPSPLRSVSPRLLASTHGYAYRGSPSLPQHFGGNQHRASVVGYMPSVDESSSLLDQTPGNGSFELPIETQTLVSTKVRNDCNTSMQEALVRDATIYTARESCTVRGRGTHVGGCSRLVPPLGRIPKRPDLRPPLGTGSRSSIFLRVRRNSISEVDLRGFAREHIRDLTNQYIGCTSDTFDTCGRVCGINSGKPERTVAIGAGCQPKVAEGRSFSPPSYSDVVTRSTRFLTARPARLALSNVEDV